MLDLIQRGRWRLSLHGEEYVYSSYTARSSLGVLVCQIESESEVIRFSFGV